MVYIAKDLIFARQYLIGQIKNNNVKINYYS